MNRVDTFVRRARRDLDDGEALLASAVGREDSGRRRRVLLVTDRRVVVAWARPAPLESFPLGSCTVRWDPATQHVTIECDETRIVLQAVDPGDARRVEQLVAGRSATPLAERLGPPYHVRVIG